jgi:hypothetical protein
MSAEQRLIAETPQLVTLYRLLEPALPTMGERAEVMRQHLRDRGVRPAMWRLLHRVGTSWMSDIRPFYLGGRRPQARAAVDMLLVAQSFGTQSLVPTWLLNAFLSTYGNPNRPRACYDPHLDDLYDLAARMGQWARSPALVSVLQANVQALLNWADREWCVGPYRSGARVTLGGVLRLVKAHEEREQRARQSASPWKLAGGLRLETLLPGHEAVLIDNPLQLWEEGQVMRHCADRFQHECAKGDYYVVSIRPVGGGRPLATVGLRYNGRLVVFDQVTGFANAPVTPKVRKEGVRLAAQLSRQLRCMDEGASIDAGRGDAGRSIKLSGPRCSPAAATPSARPLTG